MSVSELIELLQKMPQHAPVRVCITHFYGAKDVAGDFNDEYRVELDPVNDSLPADVVQWEGNYVLIDSE